MPDLDPTIFLCLAMFLGGIVSGISGFAFSAVAGAILFHVYAPTVAVPLMMACALVAQLYGLFHLRASMQWFDSIPLLIGGVAGVPIGLYVLRAVDAHSFRIGFGIFLIAYSAYMLLRPTTVASRDAGGKLANTAIGFVAGIIGGLTAFPGALPTIWCDLRGLSKELKRGMTQPFIAGMQLYGFLLATLHGNLSGGLSSQLAWSVPAVIIGTTIGLALFGTINDLIFRRVILSTLLVSGLALL
jgi:uncharacterized membrane protein YfcA